MTKTSIITLILLWISSVASHAQDTNVINLGTREYIQNLSGSEGEILHFSVNASDVSDFVTIYLRTQSGQAYIVDDFFGTEMPKALGNEHSRNFLFPDEQFSFEIHAVSDFVGTLEVFVSPFPYYFMEMETEHNYSQIDTDLTAFIEMDPGSAEDRFFYVVVNIPAGQEKVVISWEPSMYPDPTDNADLFMSRSGWPTPDTITPSHLSANHSGSDTIVLNYPNPGPVYIAIGAYDPKGALSYDGYLDIMLAEAPHDSPIAQTTYTSTDPYQTTPIYFFQRSDNYSHFFTANMDEKDAVLTALPVFTYQGVSHHVISNGTRDATPVYRFRNLNHSSHFYTADINEAKRLIFYGYHGYEYEGVAFQVLPAAIDGSSPVHRFFQPSTGSHFFTISENEKNDIISNSDLLQYEGVAWYAYP